MLSPLPHVDPACGDVVYTQTLLKSPPRGVIYENYINALKGGTLVERGKRQRLRQEPRLTLAGKCVNMARERGLLFREPFRHFEIRPGVYDLVHMHVFSASFAALPCPLVVSNGGPLRHLYTQLRGWSERRVRWVERLETWLAARWRVNLNSYTLPQADRVIAFTSFLRDWYVDVRKIPRERVDVIPHFLDLKTGTRPRTEPRRVGFVALDFEAKGGPVLLEAFRMVKEQRRDAELVIVSSPPPAALKSRLPEGVTWLESVPRDRLLAELFPSFDVFAYPTNCDCVGYVLMEAMAHGIPIAASDYPSIPEALDWGEAGLISSVGDSKALAANILRLLNPAANNEFATAAARRFQQRFSAESVLPLLRNCYERALAQ
jgi:glycosyltransferase involved in cell wall biosynthesis